jgi:hypothetical protein
MPELRDDFIHALLQQVLPDAAPSALEDLRRHFVADQPADIGAYVTTLRTQYPHAFAPVAALEPAPPAPGEPGPRAVVTDADLQAMAGQQPAAAAGSTSTAPKPPETVQREDARAFLEHLEAVAAGRTAVV